jgi:hypothetical protein
MIPTTISASSATAPIETPRTAVVPPEGVAQMMRTRIAAGETGCAGGVVATINPTINPHARQDALARAAVHVVAAKADRSAAAKVAGVAARAHAGAARHKTTTTKAADASGLVADAATIKKMTLPHALVRLCAAAR